MAVLDRLTELTNAAGLGPCIGLLTLLSSGCSLVLDVDGTQCDSDVDCVGLFGREYTCAASHVCVEQQARVDTPEEDAGMPTNTPDASTGLRPEWECITGPRRTVIPQTNRAITIRFAVTDFVDLMSPPGLMGRACNATDVPCDKPVVEGITPDDEGYLVFGGLPHAWRGYLHITAPGYIDSLVFTNRPYTGDEMPEGPTLLTETSLRSISEGGGEMLDETKGVVLVAIYDCEGNAAEGVRLVQLDATSEERPFYFEGTLPDRDRDFTTISTQLTRSMAPLAVGGYSRVDVGYVTMIGMLETGDEIGRVTVQVRPLTMSIAELNAGY